MSENFDSPIEIGFCGAKPVEEPLEIPALSDPIWVGKLKEQLQASLQRERRLRSDLKAMMVDRDLWAYGHNEDCPNAARAEAAESRVAVLEGLLKEYRKTCKHKHPGYADLCDVCRKTDLALTPPVSPLAEGE